MSLLWIKTPNWIKRCFPALVWEGPKKEKVVYLTFDDGPTPEITDWVLDQLAAFDFCATFFLIGANVKQYPAIAQKIVSKGHAIGNHTFNHWNGWRYATSDYVANTIRCEKEIASALGVNTALFRPPYGKIKPRQWEQLKASGYTIVMWDILTYDWDNTKTADFCLKTITKNIQPGSIVVFHDSKKAFDNLKEVLPKALEYLSKNGYRSERLT